MVFIGGRWVTKYGEITARLQILGILVLVGMPME
jgi:hypothetical protein